MERRKPFCRKIAICILILTLGHVATAQYAGGSGTPEDPYLITTPEQMNAIGADPNDWDKHFKLTADIDLSQYTGTEFNVIGGYVSQNSERGPIRVERPFTGTFDGHGHMICNLAISGGDDYLGLFGYAHCAWIYDLGLEDVTVCGDGQYVGSLIGRARYSRVADCYGMGAVTGTDSVGGLVGDSYDSSITNCYSVSTVAGTRFVGGLVGDCFYGAIRNSYSVGGVSGEYAVGGLVGRAWDGDIEGSFWNVQTANLGESEGGTGLSTAEMIDWSSFISAGWDFDATWKLSSLASGFEGYPVLQWQQIDQAFVDSMNVLGLSEITENCQVSYRCMASLTDGRSCDIAPLADWSTDQEVASVNGSGVLTAGSVDSDMTIVVLASYEGHVTTQVLSVEKWTGYPSGSGTETDPYEIAGADDLIQLGNEPNDYDKHFALASDIDLSGYFFDRAVIAPDAKQGDDEFQGTWFVGSFNGNGFCICNLMISGGDFAALFGIVGRDAHVLNLRVEDVDIRGCHRVGGLAGYVYHGSVWNSYSSGSVHGETCAGGLAGVNYYGRIADSHSTGGVSGGNALGGLVGYNMFGSVTRSYSTSTVSGRHGIGGLVGYSLFGSVVSSFSTGSATGENTVGGLVAHQQDGDITNSYSTSAVAGEREVGGLLGRNMNGTVRNTYSTGFVNGEDDQVGSLLGYNYGGNIADSFWDVETSGMTVGYFEYDVSPSTITNTRGLSTAEMMTAATFLEAGWDFLGEAENGTEDIWWIDEGRDYPRLWWEDAETEF